MGKGDTLLNAAIGAAVTVVLSFTGFSPLIGGAMAGYLQRETRRKGAIVGALSGVLAFLPFLAVLFLVFWVVVVLLAGPRGPPGSIGFAVLAFVLIPLIVLWNVGLGAAGGYLGAYVREDRESTHGRPVEGPR